MAAPVMSETLKNTLRWMRSLDAANETQQRFFDQTNAMFSGNSEPLEVVDYSVPPPPASLASISHQFYLCRLKEWFDGMRKPQPEDILFFNAGVQAAKKREQVAIEALVSYAYGKPVKPAEEWSR